MNNRLAKTDFNKQELKFVGREKVLESIFKKANSLHLGNRILFVTGLQGIGKSRLLQQAHHEVCNPDQHINTVSAYLNLAELEYSQAEIALEKLRTRLAQYKPLKISFNLFDYAYFIYLNKTDPFYTPSNYSNRLLQTSGFISDLMGLLQVFPGVAIGLKLLQMAEANFPHIKKLLASFTPELRELEDLEPLETLERLPLYFSKDLQLFLDEQSMKAILLLDSYDSMLDQNSTREAISKKEKWLFDDQRGLFHLLKNTLFVIANRDEVPWIKHKELLDEYYDVIRLFDLPSDDTLKALSVIPEEDIRNSILRISGGHPYTINLAYETYLRKEDESSAEKIVFFDKLNSSEMLQDYFIENITERERILLKVLSCSRFWNEESFKFLNQRFTLGYNDFEFEGFVNHAYVEQYADLNYSLHSLMKESLYSKCDNAFKEKAHTALFDCYNQFLDIKDATYLTDEHDLAFAEAFNHQFELFKNRSIEIKSLENWFDPLRGTFNSKRRWRILVEMHLKILEEFRDLSNQNPHVYLPDVARNLNNRASLLNNLHSWDLAREHYEESLGIYRKLAEGNPQSYLQDVAMSLNNLGYLLSCLHEWDLARDYYEESLGLYRNLADIDSQSYMPYVAGSLNNLGNLVSDLNEWDLARKYYEEALVIRRKLAESNPQSYLPDLAMGLNNLGVLVKGLNEWDLARKYYEEALVIRRKLAESNPQSYLPDLAISLNNLGGLWWSLHELDLALEYSEEALRIYRKLVESNPQSYLPDLAACLRNLAALLDDLDGQYLALEYSEEAVGIYRKLVESNPQSYLPDLAGSLNTLGVIARSLYEIELSGVFLNEFLDAFSGKRSNREEEKPQIYLSLAREYYEEALKIRRMLAESNPQSYLPYVAGSLNNLGNLVSDLNEWDLARKYYEEALVIYRKLAESNPQSYLPYVATILNNYGLIDEELKELDQAKQRYQEALSIYESINIQNHGIYTDQIEGLKRKLDELQ